jgi:membrane-associated phospholipid phosphatase
MKNGKFWIVIPVICFFTALVAIYSAHTNCSLFLIINRLSEFTGSAVWGNITILGDTLVALAIIFPFIRYKPEFIWQFIVGGLIATLFIHSIKPTVHLSRPAAIFSSDAIHIIGVALHSRSFPSGHAATIFTLAGILLMGIESTKIRLTILMGAMLVALSRIVVGAHWPLDILGGAIIGLLSAFSGNFFSHYCKWGVSIVAQKIWGSVLFVAIFILLVFYSKVHCFRLSCYWRLWALRTMEKNSKKYKCMILKHFLMSSRVF